MTRRGGRRESHPYTSRERPPKAPTVYPSSPNPGAVRKLCLAEKLSFSSLFSSSFELQLEQRPEIIKPYRAPKDFFPFKIQSCPRQLSFTAQLLRSCCQECGDRLLQSSVSLVNSEGTPDVVDRVLCIGFLLLFLAIFYIKVVFPGRLGSSARNSLSCSDTSAFEVREVRMGSQGCRICRWLNRKSSESVAILQEKEMNISFIFISHICNVKINYKLWRNSFTFLTDQTILKVLLVSEVMWVSCSC